MGIKENLAKIKEQIGSHNVKIIAVTKYANDEQIKSAYDLGIKDFGESYIQDALEKIAKKNSYETTDNLIKWHFIGRLQKNKVKYAVGKFCLIHSVDSFELAELINKTATKSNIKQDILLQVNLTREESKAGFLENDLRSSIKKIIELTNIKVLGLMTIGPMTNNMINNEEIKDCFLKLKDLKDELNKNHMLNLKELSMGMSSDYKIAIQCNATMIRIGKAIFKEKE